MIIYDRKHLLTGSKLSGIILVNQYTEQHHQIHLFIDLTYIWDTQFVTDWNVDSASDSEPRAIACSGRHVRSRAIT